MVAIGIRELRPPRVFIHAAMREAVQRAARQIDVWSFRTLPTAALPRDEIERWAAAPLPELMAEAARLRDIGHGNIVSYSRKVFIPLTRLCRDTCRYCTFVRGPRGVGIRLSLARTRCSRSRARASQAGCHEALFTLGDKPELQIRGGAARARRGSATRPRSIISPRCAALVLRETGLLPHVNPGVMSEAEIAALRRRVGVAGHDAGERFAAAVASAAVRITARPTRRRRRGSPPSRRRASSTCRSPPAS